MNYDLLVKYPTQQSYLAECQFYLEECNYNVDEAIAMFEEDVKFEKEFDRKLALGERGKGTKKK